MLMLLLLLELLPLQLLLLHVPLLLDETQRDLPHYIQEAHRYLMITETADRQRQAAQGTRSSGLRPQCVLPDHEIHRRD